MCNRILYQDLIRVEPSFCPVHKLFSHGWLSHHADVQYTPFVSGAIRRDGRWARMIRSISISACVGIWWCGGGGDAVTTTQHFAIETDNSQVIPGARVTVLCSIHSTILHQQLHPLIRNDGMKSARRLACHVRPP